MKVGILTYHRAYNYGAYLQACSMCMRLNKEPDIDAEIIDFRMEKEKQFYEIDWSLYRKVRHFPFYMYKKKQEKAFLRAVEDSRMVKSDQFICSDSIKEFQKLVKDKYDVIIAGSDEIWKGNNFRGVPNPYWLPGNLGCRKFSYAASARMDFSELDDKIQEELKRCLREFEYIGVRDDMTKTEIEKLAGGDRKVHLNCDPSFLFEEPVAKKSVQDIVGTRIKLDPNKKNIMLMIDQSALAQKLLAKLGNQYNVISVYNRHKGCINIPDLLPWEWLELIFNSDLVMTTYFHATCFSIIFEAPFISFGIGARSSKLKGLFEGEALSKRYVTDAAAIKTLDIESFMDSIDTKDYVSRKKEPFEGFLKELRKIDEIG